MAVTIPSRQFTVGVAANNPPDLDGNPIGGGLWMRIDGLEMRDTAGGRLTIGQGGHGSGYGNHHGLLQVADERGRQYMTVDTGFNREALHAGGYQNNGGWVQMAHGEFTDKDARAAFKRIRELFPNRDAHRVLNDRSLDVTGAYYASYDGRRALKKTVKQVSFKPDDIGSYNISDTGIIAFVNAEGRIRLGAQNPLPGQLLFSDCLEDYLQQHGYRKSDTLEVPFTHGEKPLKMEHSYGKPAKPVPDLRLELKLEPYRDTREYQVSTRLHACKTAERQESVSQFLKDYRGSRPIGAYADFVRNQQDTPGEGTSVSK